MQYALTGGALGVGSYTIGQADVTGKAAGAQTAIGKMAEFMPITATLQGAGWAMDELKALQPKKHNKKKR